MSNLIYWSSPLIAGAYLLGSVPFALLVCRPFGVDPRRAGSGNPGATNVARLLGKRWGFLTLVLDLGKAVFPVWLAKKWLAGMPGASWGIAAAGFAAFLGHLFPVYLRFRGGKGVASAAGVLLVVCPKALALLIPLFVIAVALSGYVSVGSLSAAAAAPFLVRLLSPEPAYFLMTVLMSLLIWIKHRENLRRLVRGEEKSWRKN
ncbi:glycerol-3-phosphate 1-O-acyltransferase PlsY [Thermosulfurimonas sp. F29]|uniref:glycerol-3-phosphate 1-O-acyltransferase PlsY n=1 Tax=Thermosulfurimonas sp. F29 TaxID=2867247 RepID=UPI001C83F6C4|nr:glycerol-3-phosphate 1-O-acyltransferase PlsY [Thermosulfurimonas sp. F29]MBX6422537.1 glycerol-3-phosphate 1-O-acyltransferase PlsY [Thermosulfurimonas sp. F29]